MCDESGSILQDGYMRFKNWCIHVEILFNAFQILLKFYIGICKSGIIAGSRNFIYSFCNEKVNPGNMSKT